MQAILYINNSDMRYLSKSLTLIKTVNITLKDDTNDAQPQIVLSNSAFDKRCNYIYIDYFERYYSILSRNYGKQRITLTLKRDAKTSFANQLLNCDCYANRSSNKFNTYLNDNKYPHLQFSNPVIKKFPNGFNNHLSAVLTIAGGAGV